jgi:DNA-binding NarL/FixJ family response regulator
MTKADVDMQVLLDLKAQGLSNRQIARRLGVSEATVRRRLSSAAASAHSAQEAERRG